MDRIDSIIEVLYISAQLGANATIKAENVPVLLVALEPVITRRAEYWQGLQSAVKKFDANKE